MLRHISEILPEVLNNIKFMRKDVFQLHKEGNEFKTYRKLMRLKQKDVMSDLKINTQGNLSKMENGKDNLGWRLDVMRDKFKKWREEEIVRLTQQIEYLKSL